MLLNSHLFHFCFLVFINKIKEILADNSVFFSESKLGEVKENSEVYLGQHNMFKDPSISWSNGNAGVQFNRSPLALVQLLSLVWGMSQFYSQHHSYCLFLGLNLVKSHHDLVRNLKLYQVSFHVLEQKLPLKCVIVTVFWKMTQVVYM